MVSRRESGATTGDEAPKVHSLGLATSLGAEDLSIATFPATAPHTYAQPPELQLLYETAPIGLAFLSADCRYLQINRHLTEICGISVADHIGRTVRETVPQVADQVEHIVHSILRTGESITGIEINGQRPDGSNTERFWITYWHPLKDAAGNILGVNVVAEEITERKRAEAALAASEARFRELNETLKQRVEAQARERDRIWTVSQDLLVVADANGKFLSINPAWTATLGWPEADMLGKTFEWLLHPDDLAKTHVELAALAEGRRTLQFENRFRHKLGSYCWLSWRAVTDQGHIYALARDITNFKNAEEQLRASHRELAQVSRQTTMGAMTASIAHEVNQPLGAIVANANAGLRWLAAPEPDLDEVGAVLKRIVDDGHRASEVITGIRSMFVKGSSEKSSVSVNDIVGEIVAVVHGELESHQVSLQNRMHDSLPQVMADRIQLQQVLLNLIMNALDAMGLVTDRERVLTIKSEVCDDDQVLITLEDSGSGIDPKHMDRIFDAFFTTKAHGTGMGLSICRSIIESHGGGLWASARSPHGSIFYVKLPSASSAGFLGA
jgi:PAS domain S-box-containing protein